MLMNMDTVFCNVTRQNKFTFNILKREMKTVGNEDSEIFLRLDHYVKTLQSV